MNKPANHLSRTVAINQANINNGHIYLSKHMDFFPRDLIGGSNKQTKARHEALLTLHGVGPVKTDIDGQKKFFRCRGPIRQFFRNNRLKAGDQVEIIKQGPYDYEVRPLLARETAPTIVTITADVSLPTHGRIVCRDCFEGDADVQASGEWQITNDPGAWGSRTPKYLVLGFSKGFTQANAYQEGDFDCVAFARMRPRLKQVLVRLGLLEETANIDSLLTAGEHDWAFGSLVRCSLCRRDPKSGEWAATGPLVKRSFAEEPARTYVDNCSQRYLTRFPEGLRVGILLGNDDDYVAGIKALFEKNHPDTYRDINAVAFEAAGITWVLAGHPSGSNGHLAAWLAAAPSNKQGAKALNAIEAIKATQ